MVVAANQHSRFGTDDALNADRLHEGEPLSYEDHVQYLRLRYYSPDTGRFSKVDPFGGNYQDPQSLHKYTYAHDDPVNHADPSGEFVLTALLAGLAVGAALGALTFVTAAISVKFAIIAGLATAAGVAFVGAYNTSNGAALTNAEQAQINSALAYIPGNADPKIVAAVQSIRIEKGTDPSRPDAWGYNYPLVSSEILVSPLLLSLKAPELNAATIVHETQHTLQFVKHSYSGEQEAYQKQSDFLRALGITGAVADLVRDPRFVGGGDQKLIRNMYFLDLAESFEICGVQNPAVTKHRP